MVDNSNAASPTGSTGPPKVRKRKFAANKQPVSAREILRKATGQLMMMPEEERMKTFDNWPAWAKISPAELVRAGFYYVGARDQVRCAFCNTKLQDWSQGDVPLEEHTKLSSTCPFVQGLNAGVHTGEEEPPAEEKLEGAKQGDPVTLAHNQHQHHSRDTQIQQQEEKEKHRLYMQSQQQQQQQQQPIQLQEQGRNHGQEYFVQSSSATEDAIDIEHRDIRHGVETRRSDIPLHGVLKIGSAHALVPKVAKHTLQTTEVTKEAPGQLLKREEERMRTFHNWPARAKISPLKLAKAGFGYLGSRDQVQCAFCHTKLEGWCRGDVPLEEHTKLFPTCPFVQGLNVGVHTGEEEPRPEEKLEEEMPKQRIPETIAQNQHHRHPRGKQTHQEEEKEHQQQPSPMGAEQGYMIPGQQTSFQRRSLVADATGERRQVETDTHARHHQSRPRGDENQQEQHLQFQLPHQRQQQQQQQDNQLQQLRLQQQQPNQTPMPTENARQENVSVYSASAAGATSGGHEGKKRRNKKNKSNPYAAVAAELSWDPLSFQNNNPSKDSIHSPAVPFTGTTGPEDEPDERDAKELKKENEELRQQRICKVCLDKEACMVFQPCGHLVCCANCSRQIDICAVCRAVIAVRVHAFIS